MCDAQVLGLVMDELDAQEDDSSADAGRVLKELHMLQSRGLTQALSGFQSSAACRLELGMQVLGPVMNELDAQQDWSELSADVGIHQGPRM